jgi:UDP-glucose 4-epimerase
MPGGVHVVTGGAGFIGSHLVEALLDEGRPVRVIDDFSSGYRANLHPDAEFVEGDAASVTPSLLEGAEVVYHLAAMVSVPRSVDSPQASHRATAESTLAVLSAAERAGARRVVLASSSAVYGDDPRLPKVEDHAPAPVSPYAIAKLCSEMYARYWAGRGPLQTVTLRFFNVYGPRQDPRSPYAAAIPLFIGKMLSGLPVPIFGDGTQTRDFTYVGDVVRGLQLAAESPAASGGVYNIAGGRAITILGLVDTIARLLDRTPELLYLPPRAGDIRESWADVSAARRDLSYQPETPLDRGLRSTLGWFDRQRLACR